LELYESAHKEKKLLDGAPVSMLSALRINGPLITYTYLISKQSRDEINVYLNVSLGGTHRHDFLSTNP